MEDSEDEVVDEVDVYLNKSLSPNLHIFQFRSNVSPISGQTSDVVVKVRPIHRMFEIESQIDTKSKNFDKRKSELFGHYLESSDSKADPKKAKDIAPKLLDKQVLRSLEVKPTLNQYCVGLIRDDCPELHLNPIQSVIQFKPKLNYLDNRCDSVTTKTKSGSKGDEMETEEEVEEQPDIKAITMRFAGPDEEKWRKVRERSFAYHQQQLARDEWIHIKCHPIDSQLSSDHRMSLIYNSSEDNDTTDGNSSTISSLQEFLAKIKCSEETTCGQSSGLSTNMTSKPSLTQIRRLPIAEQIRQLLINAKLLSLDQMMKLLNGTFDSISVVKSIQNYGLLVRGNWVVKSEVLYNKDNSTRSPVTGIPIDLLCRSRDYIIWRFTQSHTLSKKDICSSGRSCVPDEDVVDILRQISVFDPNTKMWSFLLSDDDNFVDKYPDVVQRQQLLWTNRYHSIERVYNCVDVKTEVEVKTPQRKRRNSRRDSTNSRPDKS